MAAPLLDRTRPDDGHTADRLAAEPVIWLGTTGPDGRPHHVPVWFCWRDPEMLIFSMPGTGKLSHLRQNPQVALNLDTAAGGLDVVLAEGRAELSEGAAGTVEAMTGPFAAKYAGLLGPGGLAEWCGTFSVPVLVTVSKIVAWTRRDGQLHYRAVP